MTLPTNIINGTQVNAGKYYCGLFPFSDAANPPNFSYGSSANQFDYEFEFGAVAGRPKPAKLAVAGGTDFTLTGGGMGQLQPPGGIVDLAFTGSGATSDATATGATITLRNVTASTALKQVKFPEVDVTGQATFSSGLEKGLNFHVFGGDAGSDLTIAKGDDKPSDLYFTGMHDTHIAAGPGLPT